MKESVYKSYDELPLFLNVDGFPPEPSEAGPAGRGGTAE